MTRSRHRRLPMVTLVVALLVLVGAGVAWRQASTDAPRADLVSGPTESAAPAEPSTTLAPTTTTPATTAKGAFATSSASPPIRLSIPDIGVDVAVEAVGLQPDGGMEIPAAEEAGWFSPGVHPAAPFGSAVLAAHIDYAGRPGAFFRLRELQEGGTVTVRLADGRTLDYRVVDRFQVSKRLLRTKDVFRRTGPPTLTLVTCGGAFDRSARHYRDNIVVQAVPV